MRKPTAKQASLLLCWTLVIFVIVYSFVFYRSRLSGAFRDMAREESRQSKPTGFTAALYDSTKARDLAHAVRAQNTQLIRSIISHDTSLINFQDPLLGMTLLDWAVLNEKYESACVLAEAGTNPNLMSKDFSSAFITACESADPGYLKLLLVHGGDVNAHYDADSAHGAFTNTPLNGAFTFSYGLDNIKMLIAAGADINAYSARSSSTVLKGAFYRPFRDQMEVLRYLIMDCMPNLSQPTSCWQGDTEYIANDLRYLDFDLKSENYRVKMEIVDYLMTRGIDYRKTPIPQGIAHKYDSSYLVKY